MHTFSWGRLHRQCYFKKANVQAAGHKLGLGKTKATFSLGQVDSYEAMVSGRLVLAKASRRGICMCANSSARQTFDHMEGREKRP